MTDKSAALEKAEEHYIHRCLIQYEILDVRYDADTETLTITIRENIKINYNFSHIETPVLAVEETAMKHELVFTKSET